MLENPLTWVYLPTALVLGALHALEPGHAKTLTAAYLIGIKGTKRDAIVLGICVAFTHSIVVIAISAFALWLGRETFTQDATYWLQLGSGVIVILLGGWLMLRRIIQKKRVMKLLYESHHHPHPHDHHHHDYDHDHDHKSHDLMSYDEHARAHAEDIPEYAKQGERPTLLQIATFGAAGGMIPCPASITVMLLALSIGKFATGFLTVMCFSIGLAITLIGVGLLIVAGLNKVKDSGRLNWLSANAPIISAAMVMLSGVFALMFLH